MIKECFNATDELNCRPCGSVAGLLQPRNCQRLCSKLAELYEDLYTYICIILYIEGCARCDTSPKP